MDIAKRLRTKEYVLSDEEFIEAADEIDRLRDALRKAWEELRYAEMEEAADEAFKVLINTFGKK